jgi:transcription antitermination factor NusG
VESIVSVGGVPTPIDENELLVIRRVVDSGLSAVPWPYLKEGDKVRVNYGSMTGVEGTLIKARGTMRLVVSVHILQRSIAFEIDREWVRPVR